MAGETTLLRKLLTLLKYAAGGTAAAGGTLFGAMMVDDALKRDWGAPNDVNLEGGLADLEGEDLTQAMLSPPARMEKERRRAMAHLMDKTALSTILDNRGLSPSRETELTMLLQNMIGPGAALERRMMAPKRVDTTSLLSSMLTSAAGGRADPKALGKALRPDRSQNAASYAFQRPDPYGLRIGMEPEF